MKTNNSPLTPEGGISEWHNDNSSLYRWIIKALCLCCMFLTNTVVHAQSEDDQLLIFRNTGETNLLYQSEIDSITFTKIDTLGVEYDEPIAQVFHTADTTLYISIAEIDSVCLGSRNEIEYRADVRVLEENPDMQWIIRYDGDNIYYNTSTPGDVLPTVGQKLYFTEQTEMFPCGLCARVDKVTKGSSEITVAVSDVEYTEIFSKFFYAGSLYGIEDEVRKAKVSRARDIDKTIKRNFALGLDDIGKIMAEVTLDVKGVVVMNPLIEYYNAEIDLIKSTDFLVTANIKKKREFYVEQNTVHFPLPLVAGVLQPSVDAGLFFDMQAELTFDIGKSGTSKTHISWTKRKDEQTFKKSTPTDDGTQKDEVKVQLTLDGRVFYGIKIDFNFDLIGKVAGAKAKIKWGNELEGKLSLGALAELSKGFNAAAYADAKIEGGGRVQVEGYAIHRSKIIWGFPVETKFLEYGVSWGKKPLDLFPKFFAHRAVVSPSKKEVSVAVKSGNEIAHDVEAGFQIVKSRKDPTPIKTVFVKDIETKPTEAVQGVSTTMTIPASVNVEDSVFIRPVFNYAGYTIPLSTICASQDPNIQPVIFSMTNGAATVVSGVPIIDNRTVGKTLYNSGPFVALIERNDTVFHEESPYAGIVEEYGESYGYIYVEDSEDFTGQWGGELNDDKITVTFALDGKGEFKCNDISITDGQYHLNAPQSGCILIESQDETVVIEILSFTGGSMEVKFKNGVHKGKKCSLSRR